MALPTHVGVVGGGRMGAGIAHALLVSGSEVRIVESTAELADAARARVHASLSKAAERGTLPASLSDVLNQLDVVADVASLRGCGLVIEAVPEDLSLKIAILRGVEAAAPAAWLATNTSSISIDRIAGGLNAPERLVGMHFFNPVPVSDLVEIVRGTRTETELVELAQDWVVSMGKTAITVADSPGFASSRLGVAIALEAMRMVEENVASPADIDSAMTLGYRHPVGPLRTTDLVGLDVRLAIAEYLSDTVGPRFEPPDILRAKVAAGELGKKTGRGFFDW